jgi:hypothetical protein
MEVCVFQAQDSPKKLQSAQHILPDNMCTPLNEDGNDTVDSVMTEDLIPSTQPVDVRKPILQPSLVLPHLAQPAENVAVPSCSPAQPGHNLYEHNNNCVCVMHTWLYAQI